MLDELGRSIGREAVSVDALESLQIVLVDTADQLAMWLSMMERFHYLPPWRGSMGTLKYLVYQQDRPVGALSFAGAGYKLKTQDDLLEAYGLSRKRAKGQSVVNSRFLILPYIRIKNLASVTLGRVVKQLIKDWEARFGKPPLLVETFVDAQRFRGICYRVANWIFWGYIQGSRRKGKGYVYHGKKKAISLYPLEPSLRLLMLHEQERIVGKRAELCKSWEPNIDVRAWQPENELLSVRDEQTQELAQLPVQFHRCFRPAFPRKRQEEFDLAYPGGLSRAMEGKNTEHLALYMPATRRIRSMQRFLKDSHRDEEKMHALLHEKVAVEIEEPNGILVVALSEFPKKGTESVGGARQYCGRLGKIENCQSHVFASYLSSRGHCLVDARFYLLEEWSSKARCQRWHHWGIPEDTPFMSKPQIPENMIRHIWEEGRLSFRWVACDFFLGSQPEWLEKLPKEVWFMAEVHLDTRVWPEEHTFHLPGYKGKGRKPSHLVASSQPVPVREMLKRPDLPWKKTTLFIGSERPVVYHLLRRRVWLSHHKQSKGPFWLIIRLNRKSSKVLPFQRPRIGGPRRTETRPSLALGNRILLPSRQGTAGNERLPAGPVDRLAPPDALHPVGVPLFDPGSAPFEKNSTHHSGASIRHYIDRDHMALIYAQTGLSSRQRTKPSELEKSKSYTTR